MWLDRDCPNCKKLNCFSLNSFLDYSKGMKGEKKGMRYLPSFRGAINRMRCIFCGENLQVSISLRKPIHYRVNNRCPICGEQLIVYYLLHDSKGLNVKRNKYECPNGCKYAGDQIDLMGIEG